MHLKKQSEKQNEKNNICTVLIYHDTDQENSRKKLVVVFFAEDI